MLFCIPTLIQPRRFLLQGVLTLGYFLSGLLGLYVGLDYVSRAAGLGRWNGGFEVIRALLLQGKETELLQDYAGARALLFGGNAYETNGEQLDRYVQMGNLDLSNVVSTHPPTAFALVLPLAPLPFNVASAVWAALMLLGLVLVVRSCGATWYVAALLAPLLLLAPPVAAGANQIGLAWLVLVFLAFRYRGRPLVVGVLLALASLTKFLPALLLMPLIARRQWRGLAAFAGVWIGTFALLAALNVEVIRTYLAVGGSAAAVWLADSGNGALLPTAWRSGPLALALALVLVGGVLCLEGRAFTTGTGDDRLHWARWNWLAVSLLPIAWVYSVLPLALTLVILFQMRRMLSAAIALAAFGPVLFLAHQPALPTAFCIACMGVALALEPLRWPRRLRAPEATPSTVNA
jgi:hypothetical protein